MYIVPGPNMLLSIFSDHAFLLAVVVSYTSSNPFCENKAVPLSLPALQALVVLTYGKIRVEPDP